MSDNDAANGIGQALPPAAACCSDGCCGPETTNSVEPQRRAVLSRRVRLLASATIGYNIIEASSGPDALKVWDDQKGEFDLLLTDMVMPGNMSGRELSEKLIGKKAGLKVIYTSGYSSDTLGQDFVFKRGLNFLPKPYHPLTLAKTVRDCLDS